MTRTEMAYFNAAKAMSELSDHPDHKLGCIVVNKHKVISSGFNSNTKCHKVQAELDTQMFGVDCPGKLHSEVSSLLPLIKSGVDLSKASIFVYRAHKDGSPALARPCKRCEQLIRRLGISRVYYSVESGYAQEKW